MKPSSPLFTLVPMLAACGIGRTPTPVAPALPAAVAPVVRGAHGLPVPPGASLPKPTGQPGDLAVLDWAGFKAAVSWTFDDAQPSHIEHYAELQAEGVPMTFYITSASAGEARFDATWVQAVKDGHELGNHSVHHCHADLRGCTAGAPAASLEAEVDQCTAYLTGRTGQGAVWTMAAPFGDGGYEALARTRFFVHRGVMPGMVAPRDDTNPANLPCYPASEEDSAARLDRQTRLARNAGKWVIFLIHSLTPSDTIWWAPLPVREVTAAMRYGRAFGDVWMGTLADVAAYWMGQKLVEQAPRQVSAAGTTWTWQLPVGFPRGKYVRVRVAGGSLAQAGQPLAWDEHGYYEVALDAKELTLTP